VKDPESYKYKARFSASLRCDADFGGLADKKLSIASLDGLSKILPTYEKVDDFQDLLPVVGNACVINYANLRDEMVDTATGLNLKRCFANKFMNVEHDRKTVVGHWKDAFYTKFHPEYRLGKGSEIIPDEEIEGMTEPFNIALSGFVYGVAYPALAKQIVIANDPDSEDYLSICISWELAFDSYSIALGSSRKLSDCEILTSEADIEKYTPYLITEGGRGVAPDGRRVFKLINNGVLPLGAALTYQPAAQVAGLVADAPNKKLTTDANIIEDSSKNISQEHPELVMTNSTMNTLNSLADIKALTEEDAKQYTLASVKGLIETEIQQLVEAHDKKAQEEAQRAATAEKKANEALASLGSLKSELEALKLAEAQRAAAEAFNNRMSALDESFVLTVPQRTAIASQIKDLDETQFSNWKTSVFEPFAVKREAVVTKSQTVASVTAPIPPVADVRSVAAEAVAAVQQPATPVVAIAAAQAPEPISETLRKAFSTEAGGGLTIVTRN
jgi:hypothetical protein